jgi:hypothetical protein
VTVNACDSATLNVVGAVAVNAGTTPACPPPAHATRHDTVTDPVNTPPGSPAEDSVNTCPHVGDPAAGSSPARYGVPGPPQRTVEPSPSRHITSVGTAVAVTDTPGTAAVADRGPHDPGAIHNQTGRPTSCSTFTDGLDSTTTAGNRN